MKILPTLAVLLVVSISTYSQKNSNDCPELEIPNVPSIGNSWQRHFFRQYSVCLPVELKPIKGECFEGGCGLFRSERFLFTVDFNLAAWRPTSDKYLPSYKEEFTTLDGKQAWIWHFEKEGKFKSKSGMKVKVKAENEYDLGLYFSSIEPGHHNVATQIFRSIRFLN